MTAKLKLHTQYKLKDGSRVPSVTTILGILAKKALIHWAWECGCEGIDYRKARDKAADIGTIAHYLIECDLKGIEPELGDYNKNDIDKAENAFIAWLEWRKAYELLPEAVELQLVNEEYRYGGTIDCIMRNGSKLWLLDFKTGKAIYDEMKYQVAAYYYLYPGAVDKVHILRLGKEDGAFDDHYVTEQELERGWEIFKHLREVYRLKEGK